MRKFIIGVVIMTIVLGAVANITIFQVSKTDDINQINTNSQMCILKYEYVTGASWMVIDSTQKNLIGEYVVLKNHFDPRLLRENRHFDMDYMAELAVSFDDVTSTKIDNEDVRVIVAKGIEVLYDTEKPNYKIIDMTFSGLLKFVKGIVDKKCWYSY